MAKKEIGDFGEKIGGARKDLAAFRIAGGFGVDDIAGWTDVERDKHIIKKEVFVKPDYQAMYDSGEYSREALYFQSRMYKALPTAPSLPVYISEAQRNGTSEQDAIRKAQEDYIRMMTAFRESLKSVKTLTDVFAFSQAMRTIQKENPELFKPLTPYYNQKFTRVDPRRKVNNEFVSSKFEAAYLLRGMEKDKFLFNPDEKALSQVDIVQYDGENIFREFFLQVKVSGSVELNGRDPEEAFRSTRLGMLRHAEYMVEGDKLHITGDFSRAERAKTLEEAITLTKEYVLGMEHEEYSRLGELKSIAVDDMQELEGRDKRFCYKTRSGTSYLYNLSDENAEIGKYEEGKFAAFVRSDSPLSRAIIGINYPTLEEAQKAAVSYVNEHQQEAERNKTERKERLVPPQLAHIHRVGEDYLDGGNVDIHQKRDENGELVYKTNASGERIKDDNGKDIPIYECPAFQEEGLSFRGVEFGNWTNQNDRQTSMDMTYDSFKDMAKVLGISEKDASLGGDLALAFGARGRGNALAHFEPAANVINITKMHGAGSLGHEWGHALDYYIARQEGRAIHGDVGTFETSHARDESSILHEVYKAMMTTPEGGKSQYLKDAIFIDSVHAKSDKGYWQSGVEMFARAFHTYLLDKLKEQGIRNDYLCGHAEFPPTVDPKTNEQHFTYPVGEERKRINAAFDKLVEKLKERGIFHDASLEQEHKLIHSQDGIDQKATVEQAQEVAQKALEIEEVEPKKEAPEKETPKQEEPSAAESAAEAIEGMGDKLRETAEQAMKDAVQKQELVKQAKELQVGDIVLLNSMEMTSGKGTVVLPPEYGRVAEISDSSITIHTSDTPDIAEGEIASGTLGVLSSPDKHWSEKLAEQGFTLVSKAEPEVMHIVYLQGRDDDKLSAMRRFIDMSCGADAHWNEDMSAVELPEKRFKHLQERIENNSLGAYMRGVVENVELSFDVPFEERQEEPDQFLSQPVKLNVKGELTESGTFVREDSFKVGEHTDENGTQDITVRITAEATHSDGDVTLDFSYMQGGAEITSDIDAVPEAAKAIVQECMDIADDGIRQNLHTIEQQAAEQAQEEAKPMEEKKGWRPERSETEAPQKRSFPTSPTLKQLEETMKAHESFAIMAMSSSGIDANAEAIRAVIQEYSFNDELKRYEPSLTFDRMVKCSQEQLDKMLTDTHYDYFGNAGIDRDAYIRGEGVLSKEAFGKELMSFMRAVEQEGRTLLVINGGADFAKKLLSKVSEETRQMIADKELDRTAVSQTALTADYFKRHDIHKKLTLENLRDEIIPSPTGSFRKMLMEDSPRMQDFQTMSKEEFCRTANVTPYQYDATVADFELRSAKIIGAEARVALIAKFAEVDGREQGILENEFDSRWREASVADAQKMSEQGKERYQNSDYEQKLGILVSSHAVEEEIVMREDTNCDLNNLLHIMAKKGMDGEGHNKGFVVMQAATTGFDRRGVGEPIQVSAVAYTLGDDGSIRAEQNGIFDFNIQASERAVTTALSRAETGFDAFKYTGINPDEYRAGKDVHTREEALTALDDFFKAFPPEEYPVITNGGSKRDPALTFAQEALSALGNLPVFSDKEHTVDFTQAIKEYSYRAYFEGTENVILDEDQIKTFSLENVVAANSELLEMLGGDTDTALSSTLRKVNATSLLADAIRMQDIERTRPELLQAVEQEQAEQAQPQESHEEPAREPVKETPQSEQTVTSFEDIAKAADVREDEQEITAPPIDLTDVLDDISDVTTRREPDTREHGKLYSDKQGDTRDVVVVEGNVRKIAEVAIPHVSEAQQKEQGEQEQPKEPEKNEQSHRMADRLRERRRERPTEKPRLSPASRTEAPQSAGTDSTVAELLAIVKAQQEQLAAAQAQLASKDAMIRMTNNTVMKLTERLATVMEQQTHLMEQIALSSREEPEKGYDRMNTREKITAIEAVKGEIAAVRDSVHPASRAAAALSDANRSLANAQRSMEQEHKPPQKAG